MIDHPARGRFNAWLFDVLDGYMHRKYGTVKSQLFHPAPETIVEFGPGAGANFRYYARGTRVVAVEPNVRMHERLRKTATRYGLQLDLRTIAGETLDVPSQSVDLVSATLVLCSVDNPEAVIAEARRVLRPGGRFVCIEHVAAPPGSLLARVQRLIARPWYWLFEGCHLQRDTEGLLRRAGFRHVDVQPLIVRTAFFPIRYQLAATCIA